MDKKTLRALRRQVASEALLTDREDLICYAYDATRLEFLPEAVILPSTVEEIVGVIRIAARERVPVVPRGAGSGFSGGSLATRGGICLAMTRMNRLLDLDEKEMTALVQPGLVTVRLQESAEEKGMFYPPDPSSLDFCTLGGNVAENAGGPRAVKYGVTGDYVLGLETVLADGSVIWAGKKTAKGVVGYDLASLLVGSEGTLGVVTKILFRLIPNPEAVGTLLASFPSCRLAMEGVTAVMRSGILPRTLEFIDSSAVDCLPKSVRDDFSSGAEAWLLIEVDGDPRSVEYQTDKVERTLARGNATDISRAKTFSEAESLWRLRRSISQVINRLGHRKINEDIVVPRTRLPGMIDALRAIAAREGVTMVTFGHAGDGNLHVNLLLQDGEEETSPHIRRALDGIFRTTLELGGTLSGEHGVGITKQVFIEREIPAPAMKLMRGIKTLFDPEGILNPGKIFPETPPQEDKP